MRKWHIAPCNLVSDTKTLTGRETTPVTEKQTARTTSQTAHMDNQNR